jgi:hypothetical protein
MAYPVAPMSAGARYGRLVLTGARSLHRHPSGRCRASWECICDCGVVVFIAGQSLREGRTRSCGCIRRERLARLRAMQAKPEGKADA